MPADAPHRIQRLHTKGWCLPSGAIFVGSPSRWANPFPGRGPYLGEALQLYRNLVRGIWDPTVLPNAYQCEMAYERHQRWLRRLGGHPVDLARTEISGHDLVCWCPLVDAAGALVPCHADILLAMANA
jgi:hypothetical protein